MQSLFAVLLLSACALTSTASAALSESRSADSFGCDLSNGVASFASDLDMDVVFLVDVSQAMDSEKLIQASALVDSVIDSLTLNPAFARWNSSDSNSTYWNMMDFGFAWNNTDNSTLNREFFEMLGTSLAYSWNNTDNNSTFNFFENLAFSWNNTDNNSTFNREFFENLAFSWNNTDNNGTSTREFLGLFTFNAVNAWNNYTDNNSTFGRNFFEMFNFPSSNHTGNYSRVGLIAVGETAETIFDFSYPFNNSTNLTRSTASHANLKSGMAEAFDMFARAPERSARQMIYVISATTVAPAHPRFGRSQLHASAAMFKREGGVIVVADVAAVPKPGLHNLASPGFYNVGLRDDVNVELQAICKAISS